MPQFNQNPAAQYTGHEDKTNIQDLKNLHMSMWKKLLSMIWIISTFVLLTVIGFIVSC